MLGIGEYNGDQKTNMVLTLVEMKVQHERQSLINNFLKYVKLQRRYMFYGTWHDELLSATKVYNGMASFSLGRCLGKGFPEKETFKLSS